MSHYSFYYSNIRMIVIKHHAPQRQQLLIILQPTHQITDRNLPLSSFTAEAFSVWCTDRLSAQPSDDLSLCSAAKERKDECQSEDAQMRCLFAQEFYGRSRRVDVVLFGSSETP